MNLNCSKNDSANESFRGLTVHMTISHPILFFGNEKNQRQIFKFFLYSIFTGKSTYKICSIFYTALKHYFC